MTIFRRALAPLVFASLVLAATGCTDDGADAEIDIAVQGHPTWVLVGPADRAEKLAEKLALDLGTSAPFHRGDAAVGKRSELVLDVPHAFWVDPVHVQDLAAEDGFAILDAAE